jgi:hypothetical protein
MGTGARRSRIARPSRRPPSFSRLASRASAYTHVHALLLARTRARAHTHTHTRTHRAFRALLRRPPTIAPASPPWPIWYAPKGQKKNRNRVNPPTLSLSTHARILGRWAHCARAKPQCPLWQRSPTGTNPRQKTDLLLLGQPPQGGTSSLNDASAWSRIDVCHRRTGTASYRHAPRVHVCAHTHAHPRTHAQAAASCRRMHAVPGFARSREWARCGHRSAFF